MSSMTFRLKRKRLSWAYLGEADWQAASKYHDQGSFFTWRINCLESGWFSITGSTPELWCGLTATEFETLEAAKAFCEEEEAIPARGRKNWLTEDEISSHMARAIMRPHSRIVGDVRRFPPFRMDHVTGFTIHPKEDEIELDIDAVLKTAAIAIRIKTNGGKDGWFSIARDVDRLANPLKKTHPYKLKGGGE